MHWRMHHCLSNCSKLRKKMTIKFCLFLFIVWLSVNCGNAQGNINMAPTNPLYWLDSYIKITCKTSPNIKVKECSWFIDDNKISSGQIYQFSVDEKLRECAITVKLAATAKNGKWRCLLHLSSTLGSMTEISASTQVSILDLSLREFVIIICGVPVFLAMLIIIMGLVVKNRRSVTFMEHQSYFAASAPVVLLDDGFNSATIPPPPSYDTVVNDRILADELARLEFSGFHNNGMEGHTSLRNCDDSGNIEPTFKTRSAPTLIVSP